MRQLKHHSRYLWANKWSYVGTVCSNIHKKTLGVGTHLLKAPSHVVSRCGVRLGECKPPSKVPSAA